MSTLEQAAAPDAVGGGLEGAGDGVALAEGDGVGVGGLPQALTISATKTATAIADRRI
jgi:hypothetical protein